MPAGDAPFSESLVEARLHTIATTETGVVAGTVAGVVGAVVDIATRTLGVTVPGTRPGETQGTSVAPVHLLPMVLGRRVIPTEAGVLPTSREDRVAALLAERWVVLVAGAVDGLLYGYGVASFTRWKSQYSQSQSVGR